MGTIAKSRNKPERRRLFQRWDNGIVIASIFVLANSREECLSKGVKAFDSGLRFNRPDDAK